MAKTKWKKKIWGENGAQIYILENIMCSMETISYIKIMYITRQHSIERLARG